MNTTKFIAHRGLSGRFPENTTIAFDNAWKTNCDGIECDIQVTKDGHVVVIHDPDTLRTAHEELIIAETHFSDLQRLNVGFGDKGGGEQFNERIPLLNDIVAVMPSNKIIQIEIKHHITNMKAVIESFSQLRKDIEVQIISFDPEKLLMVREQLPHLDCYLVMNAEMPPIENRVEFAVKHGFIGLDIDYKMADEPFVQSVLQTGLKVACWTVNDKEIAQQMIAKGITYLASDIADELKETLKNVQCE